MPKIRRLQTRCLRCCQHENTKEGGINLDHQDKDRIEARLVEAKAELEASSKSLGSLTALHAGKSREPASLKICRDKRRALQDEITDLNEAVSFCDGQITEAEYQERFKRIYADLARAREIEGAFFDRVETVFSAMVKLDKVVEEFAATAELLSEARNPIPTLTGIFRNLSDEGLSFERFFHDGEIVRDTTGNADFISSTEEMYRLNAPRLSTDPGAIAKQVFLRLSLLRNQAAQLRDFGRTRGPIKIGGGMKITNQPTRRKGPMFQKDTRNVKFNRPPQQAITKPRQATRPATAAV